MASKKRGRPAKSDEDGLHPLTILVPLKVKEDLRAESEAKGRPLSEVVRQRLAQSVDSTGWLWALDESISPKARAIGRLAAFVADELLRSGANVKLGLGRLSDHILAPDDIKPSGDPAAMIVDYWWLRVSNAHEKSYESGSPRLLPADQKALVQIRSDLAPESSRKASIKPRGRKGAR